MLPCLNMSRSNLKGNGRRWHPHMVTLKIRWRWWPPILELGGRFQKERSRWPPMAPREPPSLSCRLRTAATVHHQLDHVQIDFMDIFMQSVRYCDFRVCKFFLQIFWETLTSLAQLKTNAICPDICGGLGQVNESGEHLEKLWFSTFVILKDSGMRARSTSGEKEKRVIEQLEQVEDVDDE